MPVTMGGMASGLNTDDIIRKLVEVEARPIIQLEEEKATFNKRKEALGNLRVHLNNLNDAVKNLYGYRASYADKKVRSGDAGIVEGTATRYAQNGDRQIEVLELASTHKISTDPVKKDQKITAGKLKLEVNGISKIIKFRGGSLQSLQEQIEAGASDIVSTSYINTTENQYILSLESKTSGKKGEIKISGDSDLLYGIGLVKGVKDQDKDRVAIVFDGKYFVAYAGKKVQGEDGGAIEVDKDGKSVKIQSVLWREYVLPMEVVARKATILEFKFETAEPEAAKEEEALPYRLEIGPDEKIAIKGIELKGYNVSRIRPLEKKEPSKQVTDIAGVGIVSIDGEKREEKIYPIDKKFKGKMELPVGGDFNNKKIGKIIIYCNEGSAKFSDMSIFTPSDTAGLLEAKNQLAKPSDARIKVDGIEIQRDKNDGLNDVIKGVTLSLHGKSEKPVSLKIEPDIEKAIEKIKKFVEAYNKYLDYDKELTKSEKGSKPGDYKKNKYKNGLFIGDMALLRLENSLKEAVSSAYPSRAEKPIKIIPQMGVSTGAVNAAWESIKEGKLVIEDGQLYSTIKDNPDGVEEFFGSDTDGDNRIDHGMAYKFENVLRPYISSGKNIIVSKIDLEELNIKSTNERIDRHQEHLKKYEDKLRKKFSNMEQSISGAKAQQNWMKNQMKGAEGGENEK